MYYLPLLILLAVWQMRRAPAYRYTELLFKKKGGANARDLAKPFNQRWFGYRKQEVKRTYKRMDNVARAMLLDHLRFDLRYFIPFYGIIFYLALYPWKPATGVLFPGLFKAATNFLGEDFAVATLVLVLVADVIETRLHLYFVHLIDQKQNKGSEKKGEPDRFPPLLSSQVHIASIATIVKLWGFTLLSIVWLWGFPVIFIQLLLIFLCMALLLWFVTLAIQKIFFLLLRLRRG